MERIYYVYHDEPTWIIRLLRNSFSFLVSMDTRSMQCLLQMFLPVSQSTLRSLVASYSQEKK